MEMRISSGDELSNKPATNWVKGDLHILYQNVGRSSLMCKFIFQFPYVKLFGHDNLPNESTVTFLGIFPISPKIGSALKYPMTGYQSSTIPLSRPFVGSEN